LAVFNRRIIVTLFLGFSSGLPLLATGGTLQAWMKDEQVDLTVIGIFALVGLPYTVKFLWAPFLDRFIPPFLGRRRGWMLISQLSLMLSLFGLGLCHPRHSPLSVALMALLVSFCSASQDIVLDAHRRDTLKDEELGLGSALFINGYRLGMLVSGACALWLADHIPWRQVYTVLALAMLIGVLTTFLAEEPSGCGTPPRTLREAVLEPFKDFFHHSGAVLILAFILLYKIGDAMAGSMTTPFVLEMGYTKSEMAAVVKTFGLAALLGGSLLGGALMLRLGINRALWLFGLLQSLSILGFAWLAQAGRTLPGLASVVAFENLSFGMGTSAYVAFMARLCNRRFSATQYALFTSLMGVPRVLASTPTGYLAKCTGWPGFFIFCAAAALPGMLLLLKVAPWKSPEEGAVSQQPLPA